VAPQGRIRHNLPIGNAGCGAVLRVAPPPGLGVGDHPEAPAGDQGEALGVMGHLVLRAVRDRSKALQITPVTDDAIVRMLKHLAGPRCPRAKPAVVGMFRHDDPIEEPLISKV